MSFSFLQRGIPQEGKILVGGGGMAVSNEFFSSSKSKTQGNFLEQPRVFLFVKKEFFTREKSSWEGGGAA